VPNAPYVATTDHEKEIKLFQASIAHRSSEGNRLTGLKLPIFGLMLSLSVAFAEKNFR